MTFENKTWKGHVVYLGAINKVVDRKQNLKGKESFGRILNECVGYFRLDKKTCHSKVKFVMKIIVRKGIYCMYWIF